MASGLLAACRLRNDVNVEDMSWAFCSQNSLTLFGGGFSGREERADTLGVVAEGYFGAYAHPRLSLHGKGYFKEVRIYDRLIDREGSSNTKITEQLYLQIGHPLLDHLNGAVGRLPTPFGLNHEFMRYELPTRAGIFWDRTVHGLRLSMKIRSDLRLEAGGAWASREEIASKEAEALTFRLTQYLDLLSGAKLIASYQNHGRREFGKLGVAALVFYTDNVTSLEWVRLADRLSDISFQQVFRFFHEQTGDDGKSWSLGFEEIRRDSYRIYGGYAWPIFAQAKLGTAVQYQQLRAGRKEDQWWAILSLSQAIDFQNEGTRPQ